MMIDIKLIFTGRLSPDTDLSPNFGAPKSTIVY
jgi:hypothetical protein